MNRQTDKMAASTEKVVRNTLKLGPNSVYGMLLQNKGNYKNTHLHTNITAWERASCNPRTKDWDILDMSEDGFLGLVDLAKPTGNVLDTPRFAGWAVLEINKLTMYRAYYGFFKRTYGDNVTPVMTDTDSMILHIISPTWLVEMMQKANEDPHRCLSFDLSNVFGR